MEEDIDIEEHDLLDNPRIRTIFPDITQIKAEIPEDEYHDEEHQMEYQPYSEAEKHQDDGDAEYARFGNKIILGSKSSSSLQIREDVKNGESVLIFGRKPFEIKQEIEECDENNEEVYHEEELHYDPAPTVLIVGSKPSSSGVIQPTIVNDIDEHDIEHFNGKTTFLGEEIDLNCEYDNDQQIVEEKDPATALVILENWGPRLENSSSYCKECQILFATSNTLLAHNTAAHSFLVALDKNKAIKSTSKPNTKNVPTDSGKFCNHCNKMFPDSDSLINHLYQKLTFDKNNATFKPQPKKIIGNPFNNQVNSNLTKTQKAAFGSGSGLSISTQGVALKTPLFCCDICGCYFDTYGRLLRHMGKNHKSKTASEQKVVFDNNCRHCGSMLGNKRYYNRHVRKSHPNLYNKVSIPIKTNSIKQSINQSKKNVNECDTISKEAKNYNHHKFQCQICSLILISYTRARTHRDVMHPQSKTQNIFKKITNFGSSVSVQKARIPSNIVLKYPKNPQKVAEQPDIFPSTSKYPHKSVSLKSQPRAQVVVPKSIIFKCNKCQLHFTSCAKTVLHTKSCEKQKGDWKCKVCNREFSSFDQAVHTKQHQVSKKFDVVVYEDNICLRVLNQCPQCTFCFHEKEFYLHVQRDACKGGAVNCEQCSLPIHISSVDTHKKFHQRIHITKKNVILVEFSTTAVDKETLLPAKRAINLTEQVNSANTDEKDSRTLVLYCQNCRNFMFNARHGKMHKNGLCKNDVHDKKKQLCKICGLTYTSGKHLMYHDTHPNMSIMDMKFMTVKGRKLIPPPLPDFPVCKKCKVHFCRKFTVSTHSCKDSYKTCKQCQKKYSDLAFKLHMRFHEYQRKFFNSQKTVQNVKNASPIPEIPNVALPELLKKYEMLTDTWNILFLCNVCDIVCDSYDRTVEHCQNHFNKMESYDMVIRHCDTCNLKFDESCFERHVVLHAQNTSINKEAFTILEYTYNKLFSRSWLDQFQVLPASQLQQILSRSIYKSGRSVKLKVMQEGPPDSTIYRCGQCETYINPQNLASHYRNVSCKKDSVKHFCKYCRIPFCSYKGKDSHQKSHKTCKSFQVVYFNEDGDEQFNEKLRENDHQRFKYSSINRKCYHLHKCEKCKCCIASKSKLYIHSCPKAKNVVRCTICQFSFHATVIGKHMKTHEYNPRYIRKNIKCTVFRKKGHQVEFVEEKDLKNTIKLLKCKCGLHFISTKFIEKHFEVCGTDTNIAKEKCSKCKRLFDTTQLVTHLCKHHSKDDDRSTEFEVICVSPSSKTGTVALPKSQQMTEKFGNNKLDTRKDLFKCSKCNVYYLTKGGLYYHLERNHQRSKIKPCSYCKLKFMPLTLEKHILMHHKKLKCKLEDFNIYVGLSNGRRGVSWVLDLPKLKLKRTTTSTPDAHRNVDLNAYSNTLYKCEICDMHFLTVKLLQAHRFRFSKTLNHTSVKVTCPKCDYTFGETSFSRHQYVHHEIMKLQRQDFIIGSEVGKGNWKKRITTENPKNSDFSSDDSQCSKEDTEKERQENDSFIHPVSPKSISMTECGIIADKRNLFKCYKCDVYYLSDRGMRYHFDKNHEISKVLPCSDCKLKFMPRTLEKHIRMQHRLLKYKLEDFVIYVAFLNENDKMIFHLTSVNEYENDLNVSNGEENVGPINDCFLHKEENTAVADETSDIEKVSDAEKASLEKERNKMYGITSILFKCGICSLTAFSTGVVAHVKTHSVNEETPIQLETCHCGLIFSRNKIVKHKKIHHDLQNLSRDDLYVITMNSYDDLIGTNHVYKCGVCEVHFMWFFGLENHLNIVEHNTQRRECLHCGLVFSTKAIDLHIKLHHNIMKLNIEDFVVLQSVGKSTVKIIDALPTNLGKEQKELMEAKANAGDISIKVNSNILYKCSLCSTHYLNAYSLNVHQKTCPRVASLTAICEECNLKFSKHCLKPHVEKHHKNMCLKIEDFEIIELRPEELIENNEDENISVSDDNNERKRKLSEDDNEEIFNITENDTQDSKKKKTIPIDNKLYQCDKCQSCFVYFTSVQKHYEACRNVQTKNKCDECQLLFLTSLDEHKSLHHRSLNLKKDDLVIIKYPSHDTKKKQKPLKLISLTKLIEKSEEMSMLNTKNLYKCRTCSLHFLVKESLTLHTKNPKLMLNKSNCTICGLAFSSRTLSTHIYIHHERMKLSTEDYIVTSEDENMDEDCAQKDDNLVSESSINLTDEKLNNMTAESTDEVIFDSEDVIFKEDTEVDEKAMLCKQKGACMELTVASADSFNKVAKRKIEYLESNETEKDITKQSCSKQNTEKQSEENNTIKLYKCSTCNVCFLSQVACYKHVTNHVALDPKDYIECKLCGYQFLILNNCLHKHITKHHSREFKPEEVLIEEYYPDVLCHGTPKINIYFGNDKLQSKLISTTSDVKIASHFEDDDISEVDKGAEMDKKT